MQNELIQAGQNEAPQTAVPALTSSERTIDTLSSLYSGIAAESFSKEQTQVLLERVPNEDIEIRPDGLIYLPEIRYRRVLNRTFGPGAWALLPRSIDIEGEMLYYRGALFVQGRFVSEAIGEQQYFVGSDRMSYATAAEAAKSNCLVRCCKDLGIASDLWDPSFIRAWLAANAVEVWCANRQDSSKRKKMWRKREAPAIDLWPWLEMETATGSVTAARLESEPAQRLRQDAPPARPQASADRRLISPRQAARFRAIAREYGWSDADAQRLLGRYGFTSPDEITRTSYDEICHRLENPSGASDFLAAA